MILTRYLYREILATLLAVLSVLLLIYVSNRFVRFLADASAGDLSGQVIYQLLALKTLSASVMLIPLALFFAVLLTMGRLYRDSEMTVLQACGVSQSWFVGRVLALSLVVAAVVALITLTLAPWAEAESDRLIDRQKAVPEAMMVTPGRFIQIHDGDGVIYIEKQSRDGQRMENIFIYMNEAEDEVILSAPRAHFDIREGGRVRYLVLEEGLRYQKRQDGSRYNLVSFREHALRILQRAVAPSVVQTRELPTSTLWTETFPPRVAELQWRLSMPLTVVLLAMLAIPLSVSQPRSGRFGRIFVAILVYVLYNNLLGIAKSWVSQSQVPAGLGMWWVHTLLLLLIVVMMLYQRGYLSPARWRWRRQRVVA